MENGLIHKLSWPYIIKLLSEAKKQIRLILPSIHLEWAELLEQIKLNRIDIKVTLNNSEKYIRDGFGDEKSIQKLIDNDIPVNESHHNRISMISVDNIHYLYFSTSRIFESHTDDDIINAIEIDQITASTILASFFPEDLASIRNSLANNASLLNEINSDRLSDTIEEMSLGKTLKLVNNLDLDAFQNITKNLKLNPPVEPDLKRAIEVYNLKVQFVELKFENGKITGRRVSIPKKALPFESPELKRILDAGMKIFTEEDENEKKTFEFYSDIQNEVKVIRDKYLKPITCRSEKSILNIKEKSQFEKDINLINEKIIKAKDQLISDIDKEIEKSKERLYNELNLFFIKNPPDELRINYPPDRIVSKCRDYVYKIVNNMKFPLPHKMVEGMKLTTRFYDLTWNDLSDKELLNEFEIKGILKDDLDSIRHLRPAFEVRK